MTYDELIAHYGTQQAIADALGIKQPSVSQWKEKGIPAPRQAQFEIASKRKLRADPLPHEAT